MERKHEAKLTLIFSIGIRILLFTYCPIASVYLCFDSFFSRSRAGFFKPEIKAEKKMGKDKILSGLIPFSLVSLRSLMCCLTTWSTGTHNITIKK